MRILNEGYKLNGIYEIEKEIGRGGFGIVYKAINHNRLDKPCVVKQLIEKNNQIEEENQSNTESQSKTPQERFQHEAETLIELGEHPNIPNVSAYLEIKEGYFIVEEFIDGDSLDKLVKQGTRINEGEIIFFLLNILPTLDYVHKKGIVHRDISPNNIMLAFPEHMGQQFKLIDFGACYEIKRNTVFTEAIANPEYVAPEVLRHKPHKTSDLYSLGATVFNLLTGTLICEASNQQNIFDNLPLSPELKKILNKMTQYFVRDRYSSAEEVLEALENLNNKSTDSAQLAETIPVPPPDSSNVPAIINMDVSSSIGERLKEKLKVFYPENPSSSIGK